MLTPPWIPRDVPTVAVILQAVNKNLKRVQGEIAEEIHDVLEHERPDEIFRMGIAYCSAVA